LSLTQTYAGRSRYQADRQLEQHRLFVEVACWVGLQKVDALVDTGSQWCVLSAQLAAQLGYDSQADESDTRLHTRFGTIVGRLARIQISLHADEGERIHVETTWFISEDWPGPPVLGWKGCLERIRFALDPSEESFYFAEL
jgi:predicted aspartyl protease